MISRVPGYGHLEYLVPGLSCESQHVTLKINSVGFSLIMMLNLGLRMLSTILNV